VNRFLTLARAALLSLALALPIVSGPAHAEGEAKTAEAKHYVCPACAAPCDTLVFDAPGTCPQCGMTLIEQAAAVKAAAEQPPAKKVAILVFNNVEIIDFSGPYEMFGTAGYDVYTVAATKDPITTAMGLKLIPQYSFADAPAPDVLLVPGGGVKGACSSEPTLAWVREASAHSQHTLSVCNGAFILGQAGLLDGLTATTTAHLIDQLHTKFPKVNVVSDRRFVDNGKIVTAAGLSSGIDGALHVLSVMEGSGTAQQVALSQEYDWKPTSGYARAALADMIIPNVNMDDFGHWTVIRTEGDRERWDMEMRGTSTFSANELLSKLGDQLASGGKWAKAGGSGTASRWSIAGADGRKWTGTLTLAPTPGAEKAYTVHLSIARAS
jgi:putative intracellular protease/amidase